MKLEDIYPKEVKALKKAKTIKEIEDVTGIKVIITDKITKDNTTVVISK